MLRGQPSDESLAHDGLPPPEVVVVARPEAHLQTSHDRRSLFASPDTTRLTQAIRDFQVSLLPMSDDVPPPPAAPGEARTTALANYFFAPAREEDAESLAEAIRGESDIVETAYVVPPAVPAQWGSPPSPSTAAEGITPNQGYLDIAPSGTDVAYARRFPGGRGGDVRIIDIEYAWQLSHQDFTSERPHLLDGIMANNFCWRSHGTAVLGVLCASPTNGGVSGICPDSAMNVISHYRGLATPAALEQASFKLRAGDILLIEVQRPSRRTDFKVVRDQAGYTALEWWEPEFKVIKQATDRGVIVVEAAGNGAENLDDVIHDAPRNGFTRDWVNPFRRIEADSGAILVAAGAPPPGVHAKDHGPDRSRLDFSNFGSAIDAQAWGCEVTTCGYGDLIPGNVGPCEEVLVPSDGEDRYYTDVFSGTSSAAAIVAGVIALLQGIARFQGRTLGPLEVRDLLRRTGSPQQDHASRPTHERIGSRPDLRQLITEAGLGNRLH